MTDEGCEQLLAFMRETGLSLEHLPAFQAVVKSAYSLGAARRDAELQAQLATTRANLEEFGQHDIECPAWGNEGVSCRCGFSAALAAEGGG